LGSKNQVSQERLPALSLKDSIDLALRAADAIDVAWTQYFVVLFGMLAWISFDLRPVSLTMAVALTIAMVIFSVMNGLSFMHGYILLQLMSGEAKEIARSSSFVSKELQEFVGAGAKSFNFRWSLAGALTSVLFALVVICSLIWLRFLRF
jgi:hypothetical protein